MNIKRNTRHHILHLLEKYEAKEFSTSFISMGKQTFIDDYFPLIAES